MIPGIIIISILLVGNGLVGLYAVKRHYDIKEKEIENKRNSLLISTEINEEKFGLFDKIIEREFEDYVKLHPQEFDYSGEGYMNQDQYQDILKLITNRIYKALTPALIANISLVYKFDTEEERLTLILEKVGILLAVYRADMNSRMIEDEKNIKTNIF